MWDEKKFLYNYEKLSNNFLKNFISAFFFFDQILKTPFRESVTYGTPCLAIGHFGFFYYYHHVTYRTPCHVSGPLVIFYCDSYGSERVFFHSQVFFTLHSFLLILRPPWAGTLALILSGLHVDIFET